MKECLHEQASEEKLLAETDPKKHKSIGRRVKPFDKKAWDAGAHCATVLLIRKFADEG